LKKIEDLLKDNNMKLKEAVKIALTLAIFALAELMGGSGFIACFSGGLLFGFIAKDHKEKLIMSAEGIGDSMAMIIWTLFGAAVVGMALIDVKLSVIIYALLSLTVIRMLPVFLSLSKLGINASGKLFMGWFGLRGLASIVFAVMILNNDLPHKRIHIPIG
jgi:NhaP-type Na+/H+ and K+/H+ antiporter